MLLFLFGLCFIVMGRGYHLPSLLKTVIFHMLVTLHKSPEDIHASLFLPGDVKAISIRRFANNGTAEPFLSEPSPLPGAVAPSHLMRTIILFLGNSRVGKSTLRRSLTRPHYSLKKVERVHVYRSEEQRQIFMAAVASLRAEFLIDIDETASSPEQFMDIHQEGENVINYNLLSVVDSLQS
jgi:hypothetical protein